MRQTIVKTRLVVRNMERCSQASVCNDETTAVLARHPNDSSLPGTVLYWMWSFMSAVDVPSWERNMPCLSPPVPSYSRTLHTAVFACLAVRKSSSVLQNQNTHKPRLWDLSWASFVQLTSSQPMRTDSLTGPVPAAVLVVGEFQFWSGVSDWFFFQWL